MNSTSISKALSASLVIGVLILCWRSTCLAQTPANDNFADAIPLYGNDVTFGGVFSNATYEAGESACTGGPCFDSVGAGSIWWSWTATNSTPVVIAAVSRVLGWQGYPGPNGFSVYEATNVTEITAGRELDWNYFYAPWGNAYLAPVPSVVFTAMAGRTYHIRLFGGSRLSAGNLRLVASTKPVILRGPQSRTLPATMSVMFDVTAAGVPPLHYQWQLEGVPLAGKTKPILLFHVLKANQAGGYAVVVSNFTGVITSAVANLVLSPPDPQPTLIALSKPSTNRFFFSINGLVNGSYRIESSTNLVDWSREGSLRAQVDAGIDPTNVIDDLIGTIWNAQVWNAEPPREWSVPMNSPQKFLRATPYLSLEMCIANLEELAAAMSHWVVESKKELSSPITAADLQPYLNGGERCPAGGTTISDSYQLSLTVALPTCKKVSSAHVLP